MSCGRLALSLLLSVLLTFPVLRGPAPFEDAHHLPLPTMRLNIKVLTSAGLGNARSGSMQNT